MTLRNHRCFTIQDHAWIGGRWALHCTAASKISRRNNNRASQATAASHCTAMSESREPVLNRSSAMGSLVLAAPVLIRRHRWWTAVATKPKIIRVAVTESVLVIRTHWVFIVLAYDFERRFGSLLSGILQSLHLNFSIELGALDEHLLLRQMKGRAAAHRQCEATGKPPRRDAPN